MVTMVVSRSERSNRTRPPIRTARSNRPVVVSAMVGASRKPEAATAR